MSESTASAVFRIFLDLAKCILLVLLLIATAVSGCTQAASLSMIQAELEAQRKVLRR